MKLWFTTRPKNLISKLISWLTGSKSTHFVVNLFDAVIVESSFNGLRVLGLKEFFERQVIVHEIEYSISEEKQVEFLKIVSPVLDNSYDYKAFFYFGFALLKKKLFDVELPKINEWDEKNKFLCTEIAKLLPIAEIQNKLKNVDVSIISPDELYNILR